MKSFKLTLFTLFSIVLILSSCSQAKYGSMTRRVKQQKVEQIAKADRHENVKKDVSSNDVVVEAPEMDEVVLASNDVIETAEIEQVVTAETSSEITENTTTFVKTDRAKLERVLESSESMIAKKPLAKTVYKKVKKKVEAKKDAGSDLGSLLILILVIILILALLDILFKFLPGSLGLLLWAIVLVLLILWLLNYL
jgi:hypothetical protein